MPASPEVQVVISRRRGVSGLGILLVLVGAVILAVSFSKLPRSVYELWPLILVGVGLVGLLRRPGFIQELDLAFPGVGEALHRPRRGFSLFLISSGLILLLFTTHVVDQRVIGPGILIALGLLLLWRRSR
jgi:Domain of unknown function (DUF5668)